MPSRGPALLASLLLFLAPVRADPPADSPPVPSASDAVRELQRFYRSAPTCERVRVELRFPAQPPASGTRIAHSSIILRLQPRAAPADPKPSDPAFPNPAPPPIASLGLELGQLRVWVADGNLLAAHERDAGAYFQSSIGPSITSESLSDVLPPVLLPALDLAAASPDAPCSRFWPYATNIVWQTVEPDPKQPGRRTIRGLSPEGPVVITTQGPRLRTLVIDLAQHKTILTLRFSPVAPCDPAKSALDIAHRQRVPSMDDLRPRSGILRVGSRVPPMPITQAGGQAWDIGLLAQPPHGAAREGVKPAEHVVLIFLRQPPSGAPADRRFNPDQLAAILRRMRADAFKPRIPEDADKDPGAAVARIGLAPVFVFAAPKPEEIMASLASEGQKWGPDVLWTTDPKSTIDLFAPGVDAVVVILDTDHVLRAVVPVDPTQTAEQVADQIAASLFELGAGEGR
jgi:hypothetical protein